MERERERENVKLGKSGGNRTSTQMSYAFRCVSLCSPPNSSPRLGPPAYAAGGLSHISAVIGYTTSAIRSLLGVRKASPWQPHGLDSYTRIRITVQERSVKMFLRLRRLPRSELSLFKKIPASGRPLGQPGARNFAPGLLVPGFLVRVLGCTPSLLSFNVTR